MRFVTVFIVLVTPLRDRIDDVDWLAYGFLRDIGSTIPGRNILGVSPAALAALEAYDWPGNVRQLKAAVERACVVAPGERIQPADLPPELRVGPLPTRDAEEWVDLSWAYALQRGRTSGPPTTWRRCWSVPAPM